MKPIFTLFGIIFLVIFFSCKQDPLKKRVVGTWKFIELIDSGLDLTKEQDPKNDLILIINPDGTYESKGGNGMPKKGVWNLKPGQTIITLDSEGGSADDSQWKVELKKDTAILTGHSIYVKTAKAKWLKIN